MQQKNIPEGATHVVVDTYALPVPVMRMNDANPYRKKICGQWHAFVDGDWVLVTNADPKRYQKIDVQQQWNGEGLPPVGAVCEWAGPNSDGPDGWVFTESKVVAYTDCKAFVIMQKQGCWPVVQHVNNCQFRPIRTPEQIAEEEREVAISTMCDLLGTPRGTVAAGVVMRLYDAGCRIQVTE